MINHNKTNCVIFEFLLDFYIANIFYLKFYNNDSLIYFTLKTTTSIIIIQNIDNCNK